MNASVAASRLEPIRQPGSLERRRQRLLAAGTDLLGQQAIDGRRENLGAAAVQSADAVQLLEQFGDREAAVTGRHAKEHAIVDQAAAGR